MTGPPEPAGPTLRCGRDLLALAEQVAEGTPPPDPEHQAACPWCQEAIDRLEHGHAALRDLADEPVRPPRGLSARALDVLRRDGPSLPVAVGPGGRDEVAESVVLRVARDAALAVDGVVQASVVAVRGADDLRLDAHVVMRIDGSVPDVAARLRRAVLADVEALCGVRAAALDVTVDDVA